MNRYHHFDDELNSNNINSAAILPENDIDDSYQLEFNPEVQNYSPSSRKYNFNRLKIYLSRRTKLERFLFLLIISLFILSFAIIIILFNRKQNSINSLCLTPSCIQASYTLSSAMNQSVDPCEDFHEFTCGRWIRTNIIPKGYSMWSTTRELGQKNMVILKNILEQTSTSSLITAEQEAVKFYQSCMNKSEIERLQTQPLEKFFEKNLNFTIKQWRNIDRNSTWEKLFVDLTRIVSSKYDFSSVLPIKIQPDEKNSTWNVIHIDQPQLGLTSRDYYINSTTTSQSDAKNKIIRDTYLKYGSEILQLLGFEKNDSIKRMSDIIQFEIELATISLPMEMLQKPDETYVIMTLKQLQEQYKSISFDIYSFLNDIFNINISNPIKFNENDQVIVLSSELMSKLSLILTNYLSKPDKSHIVIDHLLFSLVSDLSSYLSSVFEQVTLPFKKELFGTESLPERWEYCVRKTDSAFGYAIGALYVNAVFGETDRMKANELIKNIREMFGENLNRLEWIDDQSKSEAKKKLDKIKEKIGYPDFIKNDTKLNERYQDYSMIENEYFDNVIKVLYQDRRRLILKFQQKVDRTEWGMTARTVNAYYSPPVNEIVFPAGILQPPFFHKDLPLAINYGAIGSVIGHEITHGFDNQGREYDADGNLRSWWTKQSVDNFKEKTKCFIEQYSKFAIDGQNENGLRTLGENIADNGGTKLSYLAYQKQRNLNRDNNLRLPGLEYNSDQLFFIAFAHTWCNVETHNALIYSLINDPHSPGRFRILGTVGNSDEFAKAFSCKSKSTMNPSNKCYLW